MSPELTERVRRAMEMLNYRPNHLARSLIWQRTDSIGMIVPDVANPFFAEMMRGAEDVARAAGMCVLFGNSDNRVDVENRYVEEFVLRRVDGIIDVPAGVDVARKPERLDEPPMVVADRLPRGWVSDSVGVDNCAAMATMVEHLTELGHVRLGYVGGDPAGPTERDRLQGFVDAARQRGIAIGWQLHEGFSIQQGFHLMSSRIREGLDDVTGIVCSADLIAFGVVSALNQAGIRVPDDVSVSGFDDIPMASLSVPALTTVAQGGNNMGATAARILLNRIADPELERQRILLPARLCRRDSTGPRKAPASGQA